MRQRCYGGAPRDAGPEVEALIPGRPAAKRAAEDPDPVATDDQAREESYGLTGLRHLSDDRLGPLRLLHEREPLACLEDVPVSVRVELLPIHTRQVEPLEPQQLAACRVLHLSHEFTLAMACSKSRPAPSLRAR